MCNEVETEYVHTYICVYDGDIVFNLNEIDDGRFWNREEIEQNVGTDVFTPNFEQEYQEYLRSLVSTHLDNSSYCRYNKIVIMLDR